MTQLTSQRIVDFFRIAVGFLTAFQLGLLVMTVYHYIRVLQKGHQGVPALYVFALGLSYLCLNFYTSLDLAGRLGSPLSWRLIMAITALSLGLPSMMMILSFVNWKDKEHS